MTTDIRPGACYLVFNGTPQTLKARRCVQLCADGDYGVEYATSLKAAIGIVDEDIPVDSYGFTCLSGMVEVEL